MGKLFDRALVVLVGAGVIVFTLTALRVIFAPAPNLNYLVVFPGNVKASVVGSEIRSKGSCTEVIQKGRVGTIICTEHIISEEAPQGERVATN